MAPTKRIVGDHSVLAAWLVDRLNGEEGLEVELVPVNPRLPGFLQSLQRVKYLRALVTEIWFAASLCRRLRTADLVHVFSASYFSFLLGPAAAILVARLYGKRTIVHYHSAEAPEHLKRWRRTAARLLRMADELVVPSDFLEEVCARHGLEARVVPYFVDRGYVTHRERPDPRPVFLANRNLEPIYNVACVLRAFARIQARRPDARLLVAGDGSRRSELEKLANELGLSNVEFLGQVPPEKMGALYDRADVYLNASDVDNMPLSILESFAAGLPVVTTDAGGIPRVVRDDENGLMVPVADDEALAAAALRLLEEPGLAERLTEVARQEFERRYSWSTVRGRWIEVYRSVIERPLRVCLVAPSTAILGGQAVQADRLFRRLVDVESVDVRLLFVNPRLTAPFRWLQRVKYVRTAVTELRYVLDLLRGLRKTDVVHVFSASYFSFVLAPTPAILVAKLFGKRVVLNYRSGEAEDHLERWSRTALPIIALADRIIVGSGFLIEVFERFGFSAEAIPNIVEIDRYRFRDRSPLRPVFFSNRNLEPHYNVACLLRAFRMLRDRYPEARLVLAGDGSRREALEELVEHLALDGVEFLGQVPPRRMPELYDAADVYLNASDVDNMPTSIIEAFAAGLPVVTTASGGIPWMVTHEVDGLLVPPNDHVELARQAERLLEDPELASRLVRRARREALERYTGRSVRDQWLGVYRELGGLAAASDQRRPAGIGASPATRVARA